MTKINLNANMCSNLLSLQKTKNLQDITQLRLSTGLKVNSAIENPSSFYTASSLNNRAEDLGALLDAMTQGIQTIKAANEGLETGLAFLQQAKSVANHTLEKTSPPKTKPDYDGSIAARVSTESELLDAIKNINPAKGAIVLTNDINMSKNIGLVLKNDMKIVGLKGSEKLSFNFDSTTKAIGIEMAKNTEISGLKINYTSINKTNNNDFHAIRNNSFSDIKLSNIDITINCDDSSTMDMSAIRNAGNGKITLSGDINISIPSTRGQSIFGIFNNGKSAQLIQNSDSELNIKTAGEDCIAINAGTNLLSGTVSLVTSGINSPALGWATNIISGDINITTSGSAGHGIVTCNTTQVSGKINILTLGDGARGVTGGALDLSASAELLIKIAKNNSNALHANLSYSTGAKIGIESARSLAKAGLWQATADYISTSSQYFETFDGVANWTRIGNFPGGSPVVLAAPAKTFALAAADNSQGAEKPVLPSSSSYNSILEQYNKLISDSGYKGVNLLKKQNLKINFNEHRSTGIEVKGKDVSSKGLGLTTAKWTDYKNIEDDIIRLDNAIGKIRTISSEFGNYYSVINTRGNFTQNLINTLTSGADKLTLADMNEESANMLALQTRQQLAINSLSLASQAAQSILKLF